MALICYGKEQCCISDYARAVESGRYLQLVLLDNSAHRTVDDHDALRSGEQSHHRSGRADVAVFNSERCLELVRSRLRGFDEEVVGCLRGCGPRFLNRCSCVQTCGA